MSKLQVSRVLRPVKAYGADGRRRRKNFSIDDAQWLEAKKLVLARRNRKGVIVTIRFFADTDFPLIPRFKAGTKYSNLEVVAGGRKRWTHSRLPNPSRSRTLDSCRTTVEFLRMFALLQSQPFRAVLDSITAQPSQPATSNVVSIDAFKSRRPAKRPALLAA